MKGFIQSAAARSQFGVGALVRAKVYSHPRANLKIARTAQHRVHRCQQTSECMSHDVRCYPGAFLFFHVERERPLEIVAIPVFSVLVFRMQHERLLQAVIIPQERLEITRQRNRALFQIFEIDRRRLAQVQVPAFQVEPPRHRFNYLKRAQAGVKPAVEHVFQIGARTFTNEFRHQFKRAKVFASRTRRRFHLYQDTRILARQVFGHAPVKEAAHRHVIAVGSLGVERAQPHLIKLADMLAGYTLRSELSDVIGKLAQRVNLRISRAPGPAFAGTTFARCGHVAHESVNAVNQQQARRDCWRMADLRGLANRSRQVRSVKREKFALFILLMAKPVQIPALIDAAGKPFVADCHIFSVTFLGVSFGLCKSLQGKLTGAYGARTRNLRRDRAVVCIGVVTPFLSHFDDERGEP